MTTLGPTAFGVQARPLRGTEVTLAHNGFAAMLRRLDALFARAQRDAAIAWASGRWRPGQPDPDRYVPGDVAALRGFSVAADLARVATYQSVIADIPGHGRPQDDAEWCSAVSRTLACLADTEALYEAVPHFLDADAAVGILASRPPEATDLAGLHLPYPRIAVWFGRVLEVGPELHDWPSEWDHLPDLSGRPTTWRTVVGDLRALGGGIEGVVLTERPGGGLADEVLWMLSVNPDASRPGPDGLDRLRASVWGRLSSSHLAHVAHNLAATVSWAEWHEPDRGLALPDDPTSRAWRKAVRRGEFRRHEPRGAAAGVRVLDVTRTPVADRMVGGAGEGPGHASPITHLRRAHWRHQRVGPGLSSSRLVRVPATVVNPGAAPLAPVVYRVPAPEPATAKHPVPEADDALDLRRIDLPDPYGVDPADVETGAGRRDPDASQPQQPEVSLP
ncbi:MAG: hypothetical protein ACR2KK_12170 [Acidimicrobiales bacterium]